MGDGGKPPVEDCLDNSKGMLAPPDTVGMPTRSENGWPNASQSFSISAYSKYKMISQEVIFQASISNYKRQRDGTKILIMFWLN